MNPEISVLMPVYNTPVKWLKQAIGSILVQRYDNFELVIVNDGSTEESVIEHLDQLRTNPLVVFVDNETNQGIGYSLNRGLRHCSGELVVRMDGDDIALPGLLRHQNKRFEDKNIMISGVGIQMFGDQLKFGRHNDTTLETAKANVFHWLTNHPGICFRKYWFINEVGGYIDCGIGLPEDYPTWVRILNLGYTIHNSKTIMLYYRSKNRTVNPLWVPWLDYWKNQIK